MSLDYHPVLLGCLCSCWVQELLIRQQSRQMWAQLMFILLFHERAPNPNEADGRQLDLLFHFVHPRRRGDFILKLKILLAFLFFSSPPLFFFPQDYLYFTVTLKSALSDCKQPAGSLVCERNHEHSQKPKDLAQNKRNGKAYVDNQKIAVQGLKLKRYLTSRWVKLLTKQSL